MMVGLSFLEELPPAPITLDNYAILFTNSVYLDTIWQTVVITLETTAIALVLGYVLAYSIVRFTRRTFALLLLVILPFWTNYIVRMFAWINILQEGGLLDSVLQFLHIVNGSVGLLYSHEAVLVGFVYVYLPLATITFYASLSNLNPHLIEASKDLGAGPIKTFFKITLPMTLNGVTAGIVLVMIPVFGAFVTPTMLGGVNTTMIGMVIETQFTESFNWPFGATLSVVVSAVVVLVLVGSYLGGGNVMGLGGEEE